MRKHAPCPGSDLRLRKPGKGRKKMDERGKGAGGGERRRTFNRKEDAGFTMHQRASQDDTVVNGPGFDPRPLALQRPCCLQALPGLQE